jgi:hypothetical protein
MGSQVLRHAKNGIIVTYDRLFQLAEGSNRKYDKPERIDPQDKKREDSSATPAVAFGKRKNSMT